MKYTDEELLNILKETSKRLGKSPRTKDVSEYGTIISRFESWNKALEKAGLSINKERSYAHIPNDQLISIVKNWIEKHNKIPNRKEWDELDNVPSPETYRVRFNKTWSEFLEMIGYGKAKKNHYRFKNANITNEEVLIQFKSEIYNILKKTNKSITTEIYNEYKDPNFLSSHGLLARFNKTWSELLILAECPKTRINKYKFSKEELASVIREIAIKVNKTPSLIDLQKEGIAESQIYRLFKTYQDALIYSNIDVVFSKIDKVTETQEDLLKIYIDFCEKIGKVASAKDLNQSDEIYNANVFSIRFNGLNNLRKLANLPTCVRNNRRYSKDELKRILILLYKEKGGRLTNKELLEHKLHSTTIMRYFETTSMNSVWEDIEKNVSQQPSC
ncbi:homing endonuclease associated repeat-containing protein (plasmid) [Bacillus nitratireducens]|uniref:homing endonuclease associated repeat-containing protein n=1 Tax=Bacillus nitratireducens TaxID=2026193 RepID=UPI0039BF76EB